MKLGDNFCLSINLVHEVFRFPCFLHSAFNKNQTIIEQIQGFERLRNEYRRSSGVELADDISL